MFSADSCFSYQSHVSIVVIYCQTGDICSFLARILIRKERLEDAKQVLARVYPYATLEQVDLKVMNCSHGDGVYINPRSQVRRLRASIEESIAIANSTTLFQRLKSLITIPVHRRALGKALVTLDIVYNHRSSSDPRPQWSAAVFRVINSCVVSIP